MIIDKVKNLKLLKEPEKLYQELSLIYHQNSDYLSQKYVHMFIDEHQLFWRINKLPEDLRLKYKDLIPEKLRVKFYDLMNNACAAAKRKKAI